MILVPILLATAPGHAPKTTDVAIPDSLPLTMQDDEKSKEGRWTGQFTLGASTSSGNTDVKTASAGFDAERKVDKNRWTFGFAWNYQESDGDINQRETNGKGEYNRFLTEKSYALATAGAGASKESNIDLLWTAGVGYGYQFLEDEKRTLSGEVGVNYLSKDFSESEDAQYITGRVAYDAAYTPSDRWKFSQSAQVFPALQGDGDTDAGDVLVNLDTRARATITGAMFAQVQWTMQYDQAPGKDDDGDTLKKTDHLILLTVGWKF